MGESMIRRFKGNSIRISFTRAEMKILQGEAILNTILSLLDQENLLEQYGGEKVINGLHDKLDDVLGVDAE